MKERPERIFRTLDDAYVSRLRPDLASQYSFFIRCGYTQEELVIHLLLDRDNRMGAIVPVSIVHGKAGAA